MPPVKSAKMVAGSLKEVADLLGKSGKKFAKPAKGMVDDHFVKNTGSGSFVLDALKYPIKNTGVGKAFNNKIEHAQRKLTDIDMKAGKKVVDKLQKNPDSKVRNSIADKFIQNHHFKASNVNGKPQEIVEVSSAGLTNPLAKARDFVLPTAGAFAISDAISGGNKKEGGEAMKKDASYRDTLIREILAAAECDKGIRKEDKKKKEKNVSREEMNHVASLCKKASCALKDSARNQKALEMRVKELGYHNEKLALENQRFKIDKDMHEKGENAEKLAGTMLDKGMIKKSEFQSKVDELVSMDKEAFDMLQNAVENISKIALDNNEGIDTLAYVIESTANEKTKQRRTMADVIENM